jgi:hypothetical protein
MQLSQMAVHSANVLRYKATPQQNLAAQNVKKIGGANIGTLRR